MWSLVRASIWSLGTLALVEIIRYRRGQLIKNKGVIAVSPRVRDGSTTENVVVVEKSEKGALIDHPRRMKTVKSDFAGFGTLQRKIILVMVGKCDGIG